MRSLYHGWYVVGASMLVYMLVLGTTFSAFGLFVLPVSAEFGLSRASANTAMIILNMGSALLAPFVGRVLDKVSARAIMIGGGLLFGLSMAVLSQSRSVWLSALVLAVPLAIASLSAGTLTATVLIVRWFTALRGRAMAISAIGMSLGGITITPFVGLIIASFGWRVALLAIGGVVASAIVLLALLIRERPRADEREVRAVPAMTTGLTDEPAAIAPPALPPIGIMTVLRSAQFWLIGVGTAFAMAMPQAILISLVPIARGEDYSMMQAASLISVASAGAIAGKLILTVVADRVNRVQLLAGAAALGIVPNMGLFLGEGYPMLVLCAALVGLMSGILAPVFYALIADRFGANAFGTVRGLMTPLIALTGAFFVRLTGEIYDRTGSYAFVYLTFTATALIAAILLASLQFTRRRPIGGAALSARAA